jgi:hypothetical protein
MLTQRGCSENEVEGRILEQTMEEITEKWRKLHN